MSYLLGGVSTQDVTSRGRLSTIIYFLAVLVLKLRALCLLDGSSITLTTPSALFALVIFQIGFSI
jgi:hypothetical protein